MGGASFLSLRFNLFLLWISIALVCISANPSSSTIYPEPKGEKVSLALYYETLCPYCANFIVNYLYKVFDGGFDSIVDLKLVPYGNAKIRSNNTITCQHGPNECFLNTIEACAIHTWPDVKEHFPFIYCVETFVYQHDFSEWETCFKKLNLDPTPVTDCFASGYGNKLELQYAAETNALEPRHTYVPWVVVNGQPLYEDYENFISYICKAYKGPNLPEACNESSLGSSTEDRANHNHQVCYKEETSKTALSRLRSAIISWMHDSNLAISI